MSSVGIAARKLSIFPKSHGAKNFTTLLQATGSFEIAKIDDQGSYVADKRNTARAKRPTACVAKVVMADPPCLIVETGPS